MFKIWWGVFCMDVSGNLGGRILGKYFCNMRHNHWVNGVWKRNCIVWGLGLAPVSDPGSLRCAWSSSLSPGLPCRYRRSEEAQGSGFVPLWVIQWQALLWVGCSQAVLKMWGSQFYFSIVLTKLLKKVEINQWDISGLKFHECSCQGHACCSTWLFPSCTGSDKKHGGCSHLHCFQGGASVFAVFQVQPKESVSATGGPSRLFVETLDGFMLVDDLRIAPFLISAL